MSAKKSKAKSKKKNEEPHVVFYVEEQITRELSLPLSRFKRLAKKHGKDFSTGTLENIWCSIPDCNSYKSIECVNERDIRVALLNGQEEGEHVSSYDWVALRDLFGFAVGKAWDTPFDEVEDEG